MAHYAYKVACYDIDYEHYKELVARFEKQEGRECNRDSNYDGDNWYIAAMWIKELRDKVAELEIERDRWKQDSMQKAATITSKAEGITPSRAITTLPSGYVLFGRFKQISEV